MSQPSKGATPRIRVLWLIKGLGPGGAERLLHCAARVGDHERFDYEAAYVLPHKDRLVPALTDAGVPVTCLGNVAWTHAWPYRLRRHLRENHYDIVHCHSPLVAGVARLVVRSLPRRQRPAFISTEHNHWSSHVAATRWLNAITCRRDAARFAVSNSVRESIPRRARTGVEVLVHGLLLDEFEEVRRERDHLRAELGLAAGDIAVITVANLRKQKSYPDLIEAARLVVDSGTPVKFLAVGQGPLAAEIRALLAESGLGDHFVLLGERHDVPELLAASDIFALASVHEGFPIAVMEALAAGLPVVATAVGGIPDAITDGVEGFVTPLRDPAALAGRLIQLASDADLRAAMAQRAREKGQAFDIRVAVRRVEAVYEQVQAERVTGRRRQ